MGGGSSIVSPAEISVLKAEILNLAKENEGLRDAIQKMGLLQQLKDSSIYVKGAVAVSIPISMLGFYGVQNLLKRIEKTSKQRNEAEKNSNFLNEPWRKIHETLTDVPQLKETFMNNISVRSTETDTPLNILLVGQAGSGKSSFVNACFTALLQEGRVVKRAVDGSVGSESITEGLTYYKLEIKTGNKTEYVPVQLIDCRGVSKGDKGVQTGDIEKICRGHIKDGYLINPKEGIKPDDRMYRQHPQEKDKIHCVVYVLAADEVGFVQEEVLDQFNTIKRMFRKDMPQLILLTKIDRLGIDDITQIFRDKRVKERCEAAANLLNFCNNDVYPQSSYSDEVVPRDYKDVVTLFNIKTIIERANDCLNTSGSSNEMKQDKITT